MNEPRQLGDILGGRPAQRPQQADEDAAIPAPVVEHDPTGLSLASRIAEAAAASAAANPPRTRKQRRPRPSAPQRSRRGDPVALGDAVNSMISQRGWTREVNLKAMLADWASLVGEANADHSTPEAYINKVLTIRTDSTAWASSLRLLAPRLVARLNSSLGDGTVVRIEVLGPTAPSWKHGLRVVRDGRGPRDTYG